jgi:hypothetical protein
VKAGLRPAREAKFEREGMALAMPKALPKRLSFRAALAARNLRFSPGKKAGVPDAQQETHRAKIRGDMDSQDVARCTRQVGAGESNVHRNTD